MRGVDERWDVYWSFFFFLVAGVVLWLLLGEGWDRLWGVLGGFCSPVAGDRPILAGVSILAVGAEEARRHTVNAQRVAATVTHATNNVLASH